MNKKFTQEIVDKFVSGFAPIKKSETYIILINGTQITVRSGKSSWPTTGAAKNALHNTCKAYQWIDVIPKLPRHAANYPRNDNWKRALYYLITGIDQDAGDPVDRDEVDAIYTAFINEMISRGVIEIKLVG
jgi:hypothetical protein